MKQLTKNLVLSLLCLMPNYSGGLLAQDQIQLAKQESSITDKSQHIDSSQTRVSHSTDKKNYDLPQLSIKETRSAAETYFLSGDKCAVLDIYYFADETQKRLERNVSATVKHSLDGLTDEIQERMGLDIRAVTKYMPLSIKIGKGDSVIGGSSFGVNILLFRKRASRPPSQEYPFDVRGYLDLDSYEKQIIFSTGKSVDDGEDGGGFSIKLTRPF